MPAVYDQEKQRAFNLVQNKKEYDMLKIFLSAQSAQQEVQEGGGSFL